MLLLIYSSRLQTHRPPPFQTPSPHPSPPSAYRSTRPPSCLPTAHAHDLLHPSTSRNLTPLVSACGRTTTEATYVEGNRSFPAVPLPTIIPVLHGSTFPTRMPYYIHRLHISTTSANAPGTHPNTPDGSSVLPQDNILHTEHHSLRESNREGEKKNIGPLPNEITTTYPTPSYHFLPELISSVQLHPRERRISSASRNEK